MHETRIIEGSRLGGACTEFSWEGRGQMNKWHKEVESRKVWACLVWFSCQFQAKRNSTTSGYQWESVGRKIKITGAVSMARGRNATCCSCPGVDYRQKEGQVHSRRRYASADGQILSDGFVFPTKLAFTNEGKCEFQEC